MKAPADAKVDVRTLAAMDETAAATDLFRAVWGYSGSDGPISNELMRAIALAGGYVAGAYADGELVGASAGFLGHGAGRTHLHSHISGVLPEWQGRHIGHALKLHQRDWALERGIEMIEWTFDPLIRRNAFFNLQKLGATIIGFEPNLYGDMNDAINAGDPTDRAIAHWDLVRPADNSTREGVTILEPDHRGRPVVVEGDGSVLRAWVPEDAVALRRTDPDAARAWRFALRDTVGAAIVAGYEGRSITRDGWYTLVRPS